MILDELPTELLQVVYRHIPGHFLWTNVRPVCRRMNNNIRRNEYWLCRLNELYGLRLSHRLTVRGDGRLLRQHASAEAVPVEQHKQREEQQHIVQPGVATNAAHERVGIDELMPALRCVATERFAGGHPFHGRVDDEIHSGTIDALRLFRQQSDGRIRCLSGARDRQIAVRTLICYDTPSSSTNTHCPWTENVRIDNAHSGWIWCISVAPDGGTFYSAAWDGHIRQWHFAESRIERLLSLTFVPSVAALCCVAEDQNVLYASTFSRGPILFDLRVGTQPQHELNIHNGSPVIELATGPLCNQMFSIGDDDRLVSVDKRRFSALLSEHRAPVSHVDYADGQLCLSLKNGQLRFFDPNTLEIENQLTVADVHQGPDNVVKLTRGATFSATRAPLHNKLCMYTPGLRPRLMASTELAPRVTRLDVLNGAMVAALSTGAVAYFLAS